MTTAIARPTVVEPGGIEAIPASRRHGSPWQLLATWSAPNLEFATVFVGFIAVAYFGLGFWQALAAIVLGNVLGSATQGILSTWGPREGLAQLVLSRTAFGTRGNILPAGINTVMAGLGWFAVNSVSGALALATLTGMAPALALIIIVILEVALAFVGHDLVQFFMRYASIVLAAIFLAAVISIFATADVNTAVKGGGFSFAGFTLTAAAAFGYSAGWNPYASDYSRYLPKAASKVKIALAAGLGDFVSCTVLMAAGAATALIPYSGSGSPTDQFVATMPVIIRDLTLVAIAIGAIAANALNVYSGSMSFLAAGVKIPFALRRAIIAIGFGAIGFIIALVSILNAEHRHQLRELPPGDRVLDRPVARDHPGRPADPSRHRDLGLHPRQGEVPQSGRRHLVPDRDRRLDLALLEPELLLGSRRPRPPEGSRLRSAT